MNFENSYTVIDFETTMRCPIGTMKASPHWPDNRVACVVLSDSDGFDFNWASTNHQLDGDKAHIELWKYVRPTIEAKQIIVGHNLPFDLQWLKRISNNAVDLSTKTLWDTALAEYVLSGQTHRMPSLDDLSAKYGLPKKDDVVATLWRTGVDTMAIDKLILERYCKQDVGNTRHIFLRQLQEAKEKKCLKLILVLNDALLACTEMMWNGMAVDKTQLIYYERLYQARVDDAEAKFKKEVEDTTGFAHINIGSNKQLSSLLFGGEFDYTYKEPNGVYKTGIKAGETKYKTYTKTIKFPGICTTPDVLGIPKSVHGRSTDEDSLEKLKTAGYVSYVRNILTYRENEKQLTTYFKKTHSLLYFDKFIYHNINPTTTITGRYSSSEPNLQNVTSGEKSDIKKCYVSRFDNEGTLIEVDFAQLEMVALAQLSGDERLIYDISHGVDIHSDLYEHVFGCKPTKDQRRNFKRASFALIYGAGYKKIARTVGISEGAAKRFIQQWELRYPGTVKYWSFMLDEAKRNREPSERRDLKTGKPLGQAKVQMPTGRILTFTEATKPWDPSSADFTPNETRNYPVQSFATGDLVPLFLGRLVRQLLSKPEFKDKVLLVNTVHDSVVLDVHKSMTNACVNVLKNVVEKLPISIQNEFGIKMQLPLNASVSSGPNWCDQEEMKW